MQLVHWPDGFLQALHARGLRTFLIDNRDAGLSDKIEAPVPPVMPLLFQALLGQEVAAPYRLRDMADDTACVLDGLKDRDPRLVVISHEENAGVGAAIATGYKWTRANDVDVEALMAVDGQMDPDDLPSLLEPVASAATTTSKVG